MLRIAVDSATPFAYLINAELHNFATGHQSLKNLPCFIIAIGISEAGHDDAAIRKITVHVGGRKILTAFTQPISPVETTFMFESGPAILSI